MEIYPAKLKEVSKDEEIANIFQRAQQETNKIIVQGNKDIAGKKVGITGGSRGLAGYVPIVKGIASAIKQHQGKPILVPAMGSHGGAKISGQLDILRSYGLAEEKIGIPIYDDITTKLYQSSRVNFPFYLNNAIEKLDHLLILNRIKPHTDFQGDLESGLAKMIAVGLGGPEGAEQVHRQSLTRSFSQVIEQIARAALDRFAIMGGIALLENSSGHCSKIEGIPARNLLVREKELLKIAKEKDLQLPFTDIDILVIKEIGKDISGTGMDTRVIGRRGVINQQEPKIPNIEIIVALDLTEKSKGNATGLGLADITTQDVLEKIDITKTAKNSLSSYAPDQGKIPCAVKNDEEAIKNAYQLCGKDISDINLVIIKNTANLPNILISKPLKEKISNPKNPYKIMGEGQQISFNENKKLINNIED